MRTALFTLALLVLATLPLAPVPAQETPGALYLTSKVVTPAGACDGTPHYAMAAEVPAAGKAYTGLSGGGFSCNFNFKYTATEDSILTGEFKVFLQVGCDYAGHAIELDYNFLVGSTSVSGLVRPSVSYTCQGSSNVFTYTQVFDGKKTKVASGAVVTLLINLFGAVEGLAGTPTQNWHIKTGNAATPSGVFGMGLPGSSSGEAAPALVPLTLSAIEGLAETAAGGTANFTLDVANNGTSSANFSLAAEGLPDGFAAAFDPANGTVEPAAAATSTLSVSVPSDATPGNYSLVVNLTTEGAGSQTANVTLIVAEPAPIANATQEDALEAPPEGGEESPGILFLPIALAVGMAVWFRRRRAP